MESRFNAFISYSRNDGETAGAFEKTLERYRIPRRFRQDRKARFAVFRDVEDLGVGDLSAELQNALDDSDFLIVLCSPASKQSEYINEEIRHFGKEHGAGKIIPVLVTGRPDKEVAEEDPEQDRAFPDALYEFFDEPLAADLRSQENESRSDRRKRLREARFQVIAKLLYTQKTEELVGRERTKRRIQGAAVAVLLAGLLGGLGWRKYDRIPKPGISLAGIPKNEEWGKRTRERIGDLRVARKKLVPGRRDRKELLIATWSMRDFGWNRFVKTPRSREAIAYLAEIISLFDIVALQELSGDGPEFEEALEDLLGYLGPHWKPVISGVSEGRAGNNERLGFLYDSRKVQSGNFTDEVVLPAEMLADHELEEQIARTPFMAGFRYGSVKLLLCTAHIYYGASNGPKLERRIKERAAVADYLRKIVDGERAWGDHLVLLGDLQTASPDDEAFEMLRQHGFSFPVGAEALPTNYRLERHYDQVATRFPQSSSLHPVSSGVFNFFDYVYRIEDAGIYEEERSASFAARPTGTSSSTFGVRAYENWRTFRMSDHLPKWVLFSTELPESE